MRLNPVTSAVADKGLRERLVRTDAPAVFDVPLRDCVESLDNADEAFADMMESAIDAVLASDRDIDAFVRLREDGWSAGGRVLDAFTALYDMYDRGVAQAVATRSRAVGYAGPIDAPALVTHGPIGEQGREGLAVPHPTLTNIGRCALIWMEDGAISLEDGRPDWSPCPWHHIKAVHGDRPVPAFDAPWLARAVTARANRHRPGSPEPAADLFGPVPAGDPASVGKLSKAKMEILDAAAGASREQVELASTLLKGDWESAIPLARSGRDRIDMLIGLLRAQVEPVRD